MTVRMQTSEAAHDFDRFLAHLRAGDRVRLEQDGHALGVLFFSEEQREPGPGHIEYIERRLREFEEQHGPLLVEPGYTEQMQKAHEEFNQPWEPRTSWD